jgi:SAM-dependent methyltransferase
VTLPARDPLDEIATGYQASQILFTANRLGLFRALGRARMTPEQLAAALHTSTRGVRILGDALVALGLLHRDPRGFRNSELTVEHLLPDSPGPRADLLLHGAKLYERWGRLYDAVKTGEPVPDERLDPRLLGGEREFARAMADTGRRSAAATADLLELGEARRLLDVGGGPGMYALEFARRWPELEIVVIDRPEALEVARHQISAVDLSGRIATLPGDIFETDLDGPYDVVFVSNVVHIYSAEDNRRLVRRCAQALAAGGRLVLKDFFLSDDRQSPPGGVLFAVNMLVSTAAGDCYTVAETRSWLDAAGLQLEQVLDVASKSRLLIAVKPP